MLVTWPQKCFWATLAPSAKKPTGALPLRVRYEWTWKTFTFPVWKQHVKPSLFYWLKWIWGSDLRIQFKKWRGVNIWTVQILHYWNFELGDGCLLYWLVLELLESLFIWINSILETFLFFTFFKSKACIMVFDQLLQ